MYCAEVADSPLVNTDLGPRQLWAAADVSSSDLGVYTIVGALMAVGVVLLLVAAWLFKATQPEMELLAPLERMSDRSWKRLDPAMQRRELDDIRPSGARPIERSTRVPNIDEDFDKPIPDIASFDDLTSMQAADERRAASVSSGVPVTKPAEAETGARTNTDSDTGTVEDDTAEIDPPELTDIAATPPRGVPTVIGGADGAEPDGSDDGP